MDGKNSLKRLLLTGERMAGDLRSFKSDYLIPREVVEALANEVPKRQVPKKPDLPPRAGPSNERPDPEKPVAAKPIGDADPTDHDPHSGCTANWKAAASDEEKRMWGMFEETGIFACACRHSRILWLVDMVRSGERYVMSTLIYL